MHLAKHISDAYFYVVYKTAPDKPALIKSCNAGMKESTLASVSLSVILLPRWTRCRTHTPNVHKLKRGVASEKTREVI